MTAEADITAIDTGGANTASEVRTALTSVLARADLAPQTFAEVIEGEDIQTAIDSVSTDGGGTVVVGPGTFESGTLDLKSKVNVITAGVMAPSYDSQLYDAGTKDAAPTILRLANGTDAPLVQSANDGPPSTTSNFSLGAVFAGFLLDGNKANNTLPVNTGLIHLLNVAGSRIAWVTIIDSPLHGVQCSSSVQIELDYVQAYYGAGDGFRAAGTDTKINRCVAGRNTGYGFRLATPHTASDLYNCLAYNNVSGGYFLEGSALNGFYACRAADENGNGLTIKGPNTRGTNVVGGQYSASSVGIQLQSTAGNGPVEITIVGVESGGGGQLYGIELQGNASDNTIVGNNFKDNATAPALVAAGATPNLWAANGGMGLLGDNLGVESLQLADPADGDTALLVRRNVGGTKSIQQVSMGAADSGGVGFKTLRVPN